MEKKPIHDIDNHIEIVKAGGRRARMFARTQIVLLCICGIVLVFAVFFRFNEGPVKIVMYLGLVGAFFGMASYFAGKKVASIAKDARESNEILKQFIAYADYREAAERRRIPLTIGFANLSGEDLRDIAVADERALSPLFVRSRTAADHQIPGAEILFVYAHLNDDGTLRGSAQSGMRQVAELTKASIIVVASPNSSIAIQKAAALPGQKIANIVFTLDRNGDGFGAFFRALFDKMREGKHMLTAWVELAPQHPQASASHAPQTILVADGGKIAFPSQS